MFSSSETKFGISALVFKMLLKLLSVLSKLFAVLFKTKVGLAATSFAAYSLMFSWQFAVLIILALAIHESGHVWAMRRVGIPTRGFYLIPFVGGVAVPERAFKTQGEHAFVAIMGPIFGIVPACAAAVWYLVTGSALAAAASAWIASLNLFNLVPLYPLDGGRLTSAMMLSMKSSFIFRMFIAVSIFGIVASAYFEIWLFVIVGSLGLIETCSHRTRFGWAEEMFLMRRYSIGKGKKEIESLCRELQIDYCESEDLSLWFEKVRANELQSSRIDPSRIEKLERLCKLILEVQRDERHQRDSNFIYVEPMDTRGIIVTAFLYLYLVSTIGLLLWMASSSGYEGAATAIELLK